MLLVPNILRLCKIRISVIFKIFNLGLGGINCYDLLMVNKRLFFDEIADPWPLKISTPKNKPLN